MLHTLRSFFWPTVSGVLLALLLMQAFPSWVGLGPRGWLPSHAVNPAAPVSYNAAVERAAPAVVNLYTSKFVDNPSHPLATDPQLKRFFREELPQQQRLESSLGSGVIVSEQGYLLTNNHVVSGADQIVVALRDGRETVARLVGSDPETDLAVLKIDLEHLPVIALGSSDSVRIGDVALAIGNPFGVGQTVTIGIISATGRNQLGLNTFEDFIQTDAAINPGNSGGALIDTDGTLIGINTAIFSRSGGSQGIGFAIPTRLAQEVMNAIVENGRVIRGWVGIEVQPLTSELAEALGLNHRSGMVVARVYRNSPALQAGMQAGDVILAIDGEAVSDGYQAMNHVARLKPGTPLRLDFMRDGVQQSLVMTVEVRPSQPARR